ncbi:hypothetical protein BG011_008677 [Mortierella polycephala]|uniref:N-acetyltransferase domain-containing protein n=1 Tax=Mortierella polycephala TaxID=41804 RepID=A0A9P6QCY2_9FUNG|nr:hypothetical protein BG011_008677 [Mortierella polycephala]
MSSAYGTIARPVSGKDMATILPRHVMLKCIANANGNDHTSQPATLFKITSEPVLSDSPVAPYTLPATAHQALIDAMRKVFNGEVERGDTYPQEFLLDTAQFHNYFFSGDAFVLIKGHCQKATEVEARKDANDWDKDLLGFFYIKPNFPICNGGFIVNSSHRGLGIGSILGKAFLKLVPVIGYRASMFNLVFVSNEASIKLWRRLGFKEIGRIPDAGRLKGQGKGEGDDGKNEGFVDAIQFYWDFETMIVPAEYDA